MTKLTLNPTARYCTAFTTIEEVMQFLGRCSVVSRSGSTADSAPVTHGEEARLKMEYCINAKDNIGHPRCLTYCKPGTPRCQPCSEDEAKIETFLKVKVRTLLTSRRKCGLTKDCLGVMEASLRQFPNAPIAQLWWYCNKCHVESLASMGQAQVDPRVAAAKLEEDEEQEKLLEVLGPEAMTGETYEMAQHIRDILAEANDG